MTTSGGKPVDATKKLLANGTLAADPEKRIQMVSDPITGKLTPKMMYHESRTESEDGTEQRQITLDESDIGALEKIVQRHRKNAGLQPLPEEEIQALIADARRNMRTLEQPEVVYAVKVDAFHFQRAVCKISYELACIWLGDAYLNDPAAEPIRKFILTGEEAEIPGKIQLGGNMPPLSLWQKEPKAHVGLALQQGDRFANDYAVSKQFAPEPCGAGSQLSVYFRNKSSPRPIISPTNPRLERTDWRGYHACIAL